MSMAGACARKRIGVVIPPEKPAYYDSLVAAVRETVDAEIREIPFEQIGGAFAPGKTDAVVLPEAANIPYGTYEALDRFLRGGGNLLTLGGPPMSKVLYRSGGQWKTRGELTTEEEKYQGCHMIWNFSGENDAEGWSRNAHRPDSPIRMEVGDFGCPDSPHALHVRMDGYSGWDMIGKSVDLPGAYRYVGLYAKGGPHTGALAIQLRERDGSLWIATVPLRSQWEPIRLSAGDFGYWFDNPSVGRGFPGDQVRFENVAELSMGVSESHTGASSGTEQEYWVDSLHLCGDDMPIHDGLSPQWKYYPVTNARRAAAYSGQVLVSRREYRLPQSLFSTTVRAQGTGFGKGRGARFVPLIEVSDDKGLRCGCLAWMYVNSTMGAPDGAQLYESSIIAGFGTSDSGFYDDNGLAAVTDVLRAMLSDVLLVEGGACEYLYIAQETEEIPVGLYARGRDFEGVTAEICLTLAGQCLSRRLYRLDGPAVKTAAGVQIKGVTDSCDPAAGRPDRVTVSLWRDGRLLDRVSHGIQFWSPKPEEERRYITSSHNEFVWDGKPLRAFGVSYMASSNIAFDGGMGGYNWEQYVSRSAYDPDVCLNDLLRIREIGYNAVALFVYYDTAKQSKNMLHLLEMCDRLGLVVDLALRPYFPLEHDGRDRPIADTIRVLHLEELDYIIGYDIAWEQCVGSYAGSYGSVPGGRRMFDPAWIRWVKDSYGTLENAEAAWGVKLPENDGAYTCPSDAMLEQDGPHRAMVAAYRRFADEFVAEKHMVFREMIRRADRRHMISARTNYSGIPKFSPSAMAYDFQSLALPFDYLSPEYYGRYEDIPSLAFTNVYARFARPDAPVVWKEFGVGVWDGSNFPQGDGRQKAELLQRQADYCEAMYKMAVAAHTGAIYYWFFPSGYRPGENSDHGVLNPDGSDRPITRVVRRWRDTFLNQPLLTEPDVIFDVERDRHVDGVRGMYREMEEAFQAAAEAGKAIAFREAGDGATTATVPDTAIGGGTAGEYNPARYVNGGFLAVYVRQADGTWCRIASGDTVRVAGPLVIRAVMANTLHTRWLSRTQSDAGYVSLVSAAGSAVRFHLPLAKGVEYLETLEQEFRLCDCVQEEMPVALRFSIEDRFVFGRPFRFQAVPD